MLLDCDAAGNGTGLENVYAAVGYTEPVGTGLNVLLRYELTQYGKNLYRDGVGRGDVDVPVAGGNLNLLVVGALHYGRVLLLLLPRRRGCSSRKCCRYGYRRKYEFA